MFVYEESELREVFPCEIEGTHVDVLGFLERVVRGEAWTVHGAVRRRERGKHKELVDHIVKNPDVLEPGLRLYDSNVHVSHEFGEVGYVDLVFIGRDGTYLLVEVKVKPEEIDKAIGQILRHRLLFASQNFLQPEKIRIAIACPVVPSQSRKICEGVQIQCFEIGSV
jgi:RecB family endonuclease NucS